MQNPTLYIFAISHFCEKARWALDYAGIKYGIEYVAPGTHFKLKKKFKLPRTSVPFIVSEGLAIQGSAQIIDWADQHSTNGKSLTPEGNEGVTAREVEKRIDDIIGVHLRKAFYSESLIEDPASVKKMLVHNISFLQKLLFSIIFPKVRSSMIKFLDLGVEQGEESLAILEKEIDWLDGLISDGRPFLVGDTFSRADLTAAALLGRSQSPSKFPYSHVMQTPPKIKIRTDEWAKRPSLQWITKIYDEYR